MKNECTRGEEAEFMRETRKEKYFSERES